MKNTIKNIVLSIFVVVLAGNLVFASSDKAEFFQKKMDQLAKAILADDTKTIMSFYVDDVYSLPSYSQMLIGKDAMAKQAEMEHKSGMKMKTMSFTTIKVFGDKNQMVQIGKYNLTMIMPGQPNPVPDMGKFLSIWQKQSDGSWKVKAEIWNTDMNPWAMMSGQKKQ